MQRDYIVGGEKRQGKPSLFPYKHKLYQIEMCSLFLVASLCDSTRTKPTYTYSQAALTDGVRVFCLGLARLALNMYIKKEMK